jgi:hypothetical protein
MSKFPKTRAAARYAARHGPGDLARARAAVLLAKLSACETALADGDAVAPVVHSLLREVILAAGHLAGPAWLAASGDDPDIAAFTVLQATPVPPDTAELDEIISRVLWTRFPPPGTGRDGSGAPEPVPGVVARPGEPDGDHAPAGSRPHQSRP